MLRRPARELNSPAVLAASVCGSDPAKKYRARDASQELSDELLHWTTVLGHVMLQHKQFLPRESYSGDYVAQRPRMLRPILGWDCVILKFAVATRKTGRHSNSTSLR